MEYEIVKEINGEKLYHAEACTEELEKFVRRYGLFTHLTDIEITQIKHNHPSWIEWLVGKGFLKEKKKQVTLTMDIDLAESIWHRLNCSTKKPFDDYNHTWYKRNDNRTYNDWQTFNTLFQLCDYKIDKEYSNEA